MPGVAIETSVFLHWPSKSLALLYWWFSAFPSGWQSLAAGAPPDYSLAELLLPALKADGEPSPALAHAFRAGLPWPTALLQCWPSPGPRLAAPSSIGVCLVAAAPSPPPEGSSSAGSADSLRSCSWYWLLLLGPSCILLTVTALGIYMSHLSSAK